MRYGNHFVRIDAIDPRAGLQPICAGVFKEPSAREYGRHGDSTMKVVGTGSIYQRDKGKPKSRCRTWQLAVVIDEGDGRLHRKTRTFHGTYTKAQTELSLYLAELRGSTLAKDEPFGSYADAWVKKLRDSRSYAKRTLDSYESKLKTAKMHLKCNVGDVTRDMLESMYIRAMDGENLSGKLWKAGSVDGLNRVMSALFHDARDDGIIDVCPTDGIKLPKGEARRVEIPGDKQMDALMDSLDLSNGMHRAIGLCCSCGLRRSEAAALQWRDIGENGILHVQTSLDADGSEKGTKAEHARSVPMPAKFAEKLEMHRGKDSDTVCGGIRPDSITQWWKRNASGLGMRCNLHGLRHAWATRLARHGAHPRVIMEIGGWSSYSVPLEIYTHATHDMMCLAVANAFD